MAEKDTSGVGLVGILKGISNLVDKLGDLAEKGQELRKTGEIHGLGPEKEVRGIYGFNVSFGLGDKEFKVEPFGNIRKDESTGRAVVKEVREPMVDIFEEDEYTLIVAEMPGIGAGDVKLDVKDDLLSILSEKILNLPKLRYSGEGYLEVHPDFRTIFTSNPEEYAGVHKAQDALMDRLITINIGHYDRETEVRITMRKSGILKTDAEKIVDIVRELRGVGVNNHRPTIRACIAIARILAYKRAETNLNDMVFLRVCRDVLHTDTAKVTHGGQSLMPQKVEDIIKRVCGGYKRSNKQFLK